MYAYLYTCMRMYVRVRNRARVCASICASIGTCSPSRYCNASVPLSSLLAVSSVSMSHQQSNLYAGLFRETLKEPRVAFDPLSSSSTWLSPSCRAFSTLSSSTCLHRPPNRDGWSETRSLLPEHGSPFDRHVLAFVP